MMDEYEYIDDQKRESYKVFLGWQSHDELIANYFGILTKKELIDIIIDHDPLGDSDGCF